MIFPHLLIDKLYDFIWEWWQLLMNFSIWSTPTIAQFFTGINLCKEKIGKLFLLCVWIVQKTCLGFNIIDSNILSRLSCLLWYWVKNVFDFSVFVFSFGFCTFIVHKYIIYMSYSLCTICCTIDCIAHSCMHFYLHIVNWNALKIIFLLFGFVIEDDAC